MENKNQIVKNETYLERFFVYFSFPNSLIFCIDSYSTVTDFARFLGLSTSNPLATLT